MATSRATRSQVFDLIFGLLEKHGFHTNDAQASIFGVTPTTIQNWKTGRVKALNSGSLDEVIARINFLSRRRGVDLVGEPSLCPIVIEDGAGPENLEKELHDKWDSVYLGHKFLYYHPAGARAWEQLQSTGYGTTLLNRGFARAFSLALGGTLGAALHGSEGSSASGIDLISLGPGDGAKEAKAIELLIDHSGAGHKLINWLTYTPVDVSIPLLRLASENARNLIREKVDAERWPHFLVRPSCSDFEDGNIGFTGHLSDADNDRRLVLFLGATFGNLRNEQAFTERTLNRLLRPGDLLWIEVGARQPRLEDDPLYAMVNGGDGDTKEKFRRALVEGPHRRFSASVGSILEPTMRLSAHENDELCEVPKSYNFVHDVELNPRQRCSVLYSRRYDVEKLKQWMLEKLGYKTLFDFMVKDARGLDRAVHLLLRRMRA